MQQSFHHRNGRPVKLLRALVCTGMLLGVTQARGAHRTPQTDAAALLSQAELTANVPATVFFHGKLGSVQMRNSAGVRWTDGSLFWAAMVDVSGYASDVQDAYQFYLVTEQPLLLGGEVIPAGAYGAGIVAGKLSILDLGGRPRHTMAAQTDTAMARPRPLQIVVTDTGAIRLYEGRHWVSVERAPRQP